MKIIITVLSLLIISVSLVGQDMPDWVKQRPVSSLYYIGIGRASKAEKDYERLAKQKALEDLASELKVQVSSNSLLRTLEAQGGDIDSRFEETVQLSVCEEMEKFHLAGTWQDEREYWVYYELSVIDYGEYTTRRRQEAIARGYDFWLKGKSALDAGEPMTALEFWVKGLQVVQPVVNEELRCSHEGQQIDVACELYGSVKNIFTGVVLKADSSSVTARAWRPVERPVVLKLSRQGTPLKNVPLKAVFVRGDGRLGEEIRTDATGETKLYVENVTASLPRQQLKVTIADAAFRPLAKGVFREMVGEVLASAPQTIIDINVVKENRKACLRTNAGADPAIVRAVKDLLARNRFIVVDNPELAELEIAVSAESRRGEKLRTGVSAMVAWYASVGVTVIKRRETAVLLEYNPGETRVLQAESVPETTARRVAVNAVIGRMNRELPERLKDVYF